MKKLILYVSADRGPRVPSRGRDRVFSLETAARLTGVRPELIRYYCSLGLI